MESILDKNKLLQCLFNLSMNSNPTTIQEANSYIMEMETNPNFLPILLEIFEQENNFNLKSQVFLVFKSTFSRRLLFPKYKSGDETLKNQIKQKLIDYMQQFKETPFLLKNIQSAILNVVESDFPLNYKALIEYLKNGFGVISGQISSNPMFLIEKQTINFFTEAKKIFKRKSQAKNLPRMAENQFRDFFEPFLETLFSTINIINLNFNEAINNSNKSISLQYISISTLSDEIILMLLQYIHQDANLEEIVKIVVNKMFEKCSMLIEILLKGQKSLNQEIKKLLSKNIKVIVYQLSNIQYHLPSIFHIFLGQYLQLIKFILDNNLSLSNEKILKSALICNLKLLKTFFYFSDSLIYQKSLTKHEKNLEKKIEIHSMISQNVLSIFTDSLIEQFLFTFLQNILIQEFNKQKDEDNYENLIEIDTEDGLDDNTNEMENSVYNLTIVNLELLFVRFPNNCLQKINNLTLQLISSDSDTIDKPIQDGIFAILGIIPKAFLKLKIGKNPTELIDILRVLEFIKNNFSKDVLYVRRFAALTMKWMNVLDENTIMTISQLIYQILISFKNHLIQYESMKCLYEIIKNKNIVLNFEEILLNSVPILINILEKFNNPVIISPLIDFLNILLEKTQSQSQTIFTTLIQNPFFKKLIQNDSEILRNAVCEMFKNLILAFNDNPHLNEIFNVAIEFIDQSFQIYLQSKEKYEGGVLKLWLLVLKQYQCFESEKIILNYLKQLFQKNLKKILIWNIESDLEVVVEILEENFLLNLEPNSDNYLWLVNFIEDKYEFSNKLIHEDSIATIKISILSLLASVILKLSNQNKGFNFNIFEKVILLMLSDLMRPQFLSKSKKFHGFTTSLLSLMNRFLINYQMNIFQILENHGKIDEFIECWIYLMKEISSGNACKINIIAVFANITVLEKTKSFFEHFDKLIENLLSNFSSCIKYDGQAEKVGMENNRGKNVLTNKSCEKPISTRKEILRKTNLFDEYEIKTLFYSNMQDMLNKKNYKQLIKNPEILQKLASINL